MAASTSCVVSRGTVSYELIADDDPTAANIANAVLLSGTSAMRMTSSPPNAK